MTTYVALLRAINVGGRSKVQMSDLKEGFVAAGCRQVRTYIQSGNVIFKAPESKLAAITERVDSEVQRLLGTKVTIVYRTIDEIEDIARAAPFKGLETDRQVKLYVCFLSRNPTRKPSLPLLLPKEALEAIKVRKLHVFVVSRRKANGGYGFPNNFVENEFGVRATTRNWSTVRKIAELASR